MFWYTVVKIFCICSCDSKSERDVRESFQLHVQWVMQRAGSINYPHPLTTAAVMWTISVLLKDPGKKQLVEDLLFLLSHNQRLWFLSKIKPDNTNFYNHHKPALGCFSEDKFYLTPINTSRKDCKATLNFLERCNYFICLMPSCSVLF